MQEGMITNQARHRWGILQKEFSGSKSQESGI